MVPDTSNTQVRGRGAVDAGLQRARAARVEVGHLVHRAAAAGRRFHAKAGRAGDDRARPARWWRPAPRGRGLTGPELTWLHDVTCDCMVVTDTSKLHYGTLSENRKMFVRWTSRRSWSAGLRGRSVHGDHREIPDAARQRAELIGSGGRVADEHALVEVVAVAAIQDAIARQVIERRAIELRRRRFPAQRGDAAWPPRPAP